MRLEHFEVIEPVCPVCRDVSFESRLELKSIDERHSDTVIQGRLECTNDACRREYPIIDGIPLIIPDLRSYLQESAGDVLLRPDLSLNSESVIGDCCGPSSRYNTIRQQLSSYVWDHYGEFDPDETKDEPNPGTMLRALQAGLQLADFSLNNQPILDLGCGVGRGAFALASHFDSLVLGVDLHFPMLRLASGLLRNQRLKYSRRRVGMVYDRREFPVPLENQERVDFWACDATALPFPAARFGAVVSMNLLDCVASPMAYLHSLAATLAHGSDALIATPYDWSDSVTPPESWLGGHSQRAAFGGASEPVLRELLNPSSPHAVPGLQWIGEANQPWQVRLHDRSFVSYQTHLVALRKLNDVANE